MENFFCVKFFRVLLFFQFLNDGDFMIEQPRKEMHYGKEVWVNPTTETLRRNECLCLNGCANMKPGQLDHCPIAQRLYQVCMDGNVALAVTRCGLYKPVKADPVSTCS